MTGAVEGLEAQRPTAPSSGSRRVRGAWPRRLSTLLAVVAAFALLVGLSLGWASDNLFDADQFATRSVEMLDSSAVRVALAEDLTDALIANGASQLVSFRTPLEGIIEGVMQTDAFRGIFRNAVAEAHRAVFERDGDSVVLNLVQSLTIITNTVKVIDPTLAASLPTDLSQVLVDVTDEVRGLALWQVAEEVDSLAGWALLVAFGAGIAAVVVEPRRRVGVVKVAGSVVAAGLLLAVTTALAPGIIAGRVSDPALAVGVRAGVQSFLADLQSMAIWVTGYGLLLAAAAVATAPTTDRVDLAAVAERARRVLTYQPGSRGGRVARGALLLVGGLALITNREAVVPFAVGLAGALVAFLGMYQLMAVVGRRPGDRLLDADEARALTRERVELARVGWVTAVVVLLAGLVTAGLVFSTSRAGRAAEAAGEMRCNGHVELCDRTLDLVAFAGSHNAQSSSRQPGWLFAEQLNGVTAQLESGVRALLIKSHYGHETTVKMPGTSVNVVVTDIAREAVTFPGIEEEELGTDAVNQAKAIAAGAQSTTPSADEVYLCHVYCELGAVAFVDWLGEVKAFLDRNPNEVILLFIGDYVATEDTEAVFAEAGLDDRVWEYDPSKPFPTLREMIGQNRQLFVLSEHSRPPPSWYVEGYGIFQDTPYTFATPDDFSCAPNRGPADAPLFQINHWITNKEPPNANQAKQVNAYDVLMTRVRRCQQERGRFPNIVGVNFASEGDLMQVVDELNGVDS